MTDQTPSQFSTPAAPDLAAEQPARPGAARWRTRRVPLAIAGATLLLGCVLGAGAAALGAVAIGGWSEGGGHSVRHDRDDDSRDRATPAPTPTATPATATPSPSAS